MSDIVSSGIQAGGFDSAVSPVLSEETYNHLLLFVSSKDQKVLEKMRIRRLSQRMWTSLIIRHSRKQRIRLYIS